MSRACAGAERPLPALLAGRLAIRRQPLTTLSADGAWLSYVAHKTALSTLRCPF